MFVAYAAPNFSMTPVARFTRPAGPGIGVPVFASSWIRNPFVVAITIRGATCGGVPGQYEIPRPPADGFVARPGIVLRSNFQSSVPASALSATMVVPWTGKYMTLLMTSGVTVYPDAGAPVSYVQAFASRVTLVGVMC